MAGTVAIHVDDDTIARLRAVAATENRPASQIVAVALRTLLNLSPGARRALYAIDGAAEAERDFAGRLVGRATLKAYERMLDARHAGEPDPLGNAPADPEDTIEAEAVRLSRRCCIISD
jgi:hypothetical protein